MHEASRFSDRTLQLAQEGAYAVLARAQELEGQGRTILHLELGQPDFPTPEAIRSAGAEAIHDGRSRYTHPAGLQDFRKAIAETASSQRGVRYSAENVVVGPGTKPGIFLTAMAILRPGDEVVLPDPGFPSYRAIVQAVGARVVEAPLSEVRRFSYDLDAFDRALSDRTRLIIVNSPSNPTGGLVPVEDLMHIARRARELDAWVISDEIYSRIVFGGNGLAPSIGAQEGMLERTIVVDGFSKAFAMTGWRLGYVIAPPALARTLEVLSTHVLGSAAEFTQWAGLEALTSSQDAVVAMVSEYRRRRDRILALLNTIPGVHAQQPDGAFYVFPNVGSFGRTAAEIQARLLDEAGVAVLAGTDFGPGGEGHLRLCFATPLETIERAIEQMARFFEAG